MEQTCITPEQLELEYQEFTAPKLGGPAPDGYDWSRKLDGNVAFRIPKENEFFFGKTSKLNKVLTSWCVGGKRVILTKPIPLSNIPERTFFIGRIGKTNTKPSLLAKTNEFCTSFLVYTENPSISLSQADCTDIQAYDFRPINLKFNVNADVGALSVGPSEVNIGAFFECHMDTYVDRFFCMAASGEVVSLNTLLVWNNSVLNSVHNIRLIHEIKFELKDLEEG